MTKEEILSLYLEVLQATEAARIPAQGTGANEGGGVFLQRLPRAEKKRRHQVLLQGPNLSMPNSQRVEPLVEGRPQ